MPPQKNSTQLDPSKVTRPIQLLAAWLVGLVLVDGSFLASAAYISRPEWVAGALVVAAILNVPLFIGAIFLLQTRFRPQMQEDQYYSKYLMQPQPLRQTRASLGPAHSSKDLQTAAKASATQLHTLMTDE